VLPRAPGDYRARIALRRHTSDTFEWETFDELALGPLRPADVSAAFRSLLHAAEKEPPGDARGRVVAAMPRTARALGRLYDLEALSLAADADGTRRVEIAVRQRPDRLKAEMPKLAAYLARRSRGVVLTAAASLRDGRPLWSADVEEGRSRLRLRIRDAQLVPLVGPAAHPPGPLRLRSDYSFKAGPFRVGVRGLVAEVELGAGGAPLGFAARFVEQPDWRIPFLIEPFMRASLRHPFEGAGSGFSLAMREDAARGSVLQVDSRLQVQESWIVRWFGGFSAKAMAELRAAEAEADRYALECLTALRDDVAALAGAPPPVSGVRPDPGRETVHEPLQERLGIGPRQVALPVEETLGHVDEHLGLSQGGHVEVRERVPQVLLGDRAADRADRRPDDRGRLARPRALAVRP
jgi:hypothetical protein